ncbi:MAG: hypothetical protein U1F98_02235 [Verrucomicrobiota bacterium]
MSENIKTVNRPVKWSLLRRGPRTFALLGRATPGGLASFSRDEVTRGWALTAEYGCLRLERLSGEEELTGDSLILPNPFAYEYGIAGANNSDETTRAVFGLLSSELEQLVTTLRKGSFPVLGYSPKDLKCSVSSCVIPAYWPHVVVSNLALYGNVVSLESFVRIVVSSLPQGHLGARFPVLQPVIKQMFGMSIMYRRGIPYSKELLESVPTVDANAR